jgi:hypothetical protein
MNWQVENRSKNQCCSVKLYEILETYSERFQKDEYFFASQDLISAAFSLWRAVFLTDKTGRRVEVLKMSQLFLSNVILDNSISYAQDKLTREWTFNYYLENARFRLERLHRKHPKLVQAWENKKRRAQPRWEYAQDILTRAIDSFEKDFKK